MTDAELIDELSALNGSERYQRVIEREALRRILKLLTLPLPEPAKPKRQKSSKPTTAEWIAYATQMDEPLTGTQALGAWDYYEANGWRVGKNAMSDWKAALRGWGRRQKDFTPARSGKLSYEQELELHKPDPNSENGW